MTNREKYKKAFSTLHASEKISLEEGLMEKKKQAYIIRKTAAACVAAAVVLGSASVAYAADLGGIQEKISAWFHGEQTEVNVTDNGDGSYTYTYTDQDGETHEESGGGIAIDDSGNETPLSAEDVLRQAGAEDVDEDAQGNVWLYFYDRKMNITDLFDGAGECKVAVKNSGYTAYEGEMVYFDITTSTYEEDGESSNVYGFTTTTTPPADVDNYTVME